MPSEFVEQHSMTRPPVAAYDGVNFRRLLPDIHRLAEVAWDAVRGADPPLPECSPRWRETLFDRAESAVRARSVVADFPAAGEAFEREFLRLWGGA
jgi:hypothetical protein